MATALSNCRTLLDDVLAKGMAVILDGGVIVEVAASGDSRVRRPA